VVKRGVPARLCVAGKGPLEHNLKALSERLGVADRMDIPHAPRNRKIYPNEESALKIVCMAIHEASKRWTRPIRHWKQALNHFAILYEGRMPEPISK